MPPFPIPVDLFDHYCTMYSQISQKKFPDPFGMEVLRIKNEIGTLIGVISGQHIHGQFLMFRLKTGEMLVSGSVTDLKMLSNMFTYDQIEYYGILNHDVVRKLSSIFI